MSATIEEDTDFKKFESRIKRRILMNHTEGRIIIEEIFKGLKNAVIEEYDSDFALKNNNNGKFKEFLEQKKNGDMGVDGENIDKNIKSLSYIIMGLLKFNTSKDEEKNIKKIITN